MSKYIIDIPKTVGMGKVGSVHYTYFDGIQCQTIVLKSDEIEELNADYINEHYGDLQDEAYKKGLHDGESKCGYCNEYKRGLDDAWEAARKIVKMPDPPYWGVFDEYKDDLFRKITAAEAIEKLKVYEEKQKADDEIKVGDEVRHDGGHIFVVTAVDNISVYGIDGTGDFKHSLKCNVHRTDRHFDIDKILEDMRK